MNVESLVFLYIFYSAFLLFHVCEFNIIKKKIFVTVGCIIWKTGFVEMIPINPPYVKLDWPICISGMNLSPVERNFMTISFILILVVLE